MAYPESLKAHLQGGVTTLARAWALARADGRVLGFTDHDVVLRFDGISFEPGSGMTAKAVLQGTGLSVDNTESYGALSSEAITEADLLAGRYDGAAVTVWLVNWADPAMRAVIFRGHLGEVSRGAGAFTAELRGLTAALGQEQGRIYHPRCAAVLGDGRCRFDLTKDGYALEAALGGVDEAVVLRLAEGAGFEDRWFEKGRLVVLDGAAAGLIGVVKNDRLQADGSRLIELWQRLGANPVAGDRVRIEPGCDKRAGTCRLKFDNFLNFRGFPHIPGEDWMVSYPVQSGTNDGGSLFR
ncbi:DUF2163 domain-containing protein [Rhodobacter capsulatus]|jgi:uncharacterized phage protein (TIGR02218 family)|uniref:Bacteriophage phiJL001 Gp84 C-terminal domain-containing protein n=3 Tax=root TaxID=1 RepID=D5AU02_RHOCB|nr:DUF2163 domain-containing protein [Rhodobacter capsulatus]6TBA_7A Chain 7A, Uncharacterized protein [Rhodobacter capsulatus SB 1003]6TBA_7B Chain 7B, Uncharacterized protein [Rhodobacter capsulatus SB 1003]6TBA_7C Chain 7C, Uncharacterized protein [Rhodobacter capsulatus SB 1003]6TEH_C Chain C, Putative gene transfer agent protein [Rhodobacter capsulatus]DBA12214.1 TPA_asm: baseplate hub protein [Rhodobactegtaviriform marrsi]ABK27261.1 putative gene transfer agent protein [Rhodobacter caps